MLLGVKECKLVKKKYIRRNIEVEFSELLESVCVFLIIVSLMLE